MATMSADYNRRWRAANPDRSAAIHKRWRDKLRLRALRRYGGDVPACACCGETTVEFLAIDHADGGGNEHRREVGTRGGTEFYAWLRREGWPDGYRVLCHNCNHALGAYGYCPHQLAAPAAQLVLGAPEDKPLRVPTRVNAWQR